MNHLIIIAVMALVARGAFVSMGEKMILEPLGKLVALIPWEGLRKPLGSCSYCMVSAWGITAACALDLLPCPEIVWYDWFPMIHWDVFPEIIVYLLCAVGLQSMMER